MNRDALRAAAPDPRKVDPTWWQRAVVHFIGSVVEAIASEGREPDLWEGQDLAAALGYAFIGWHSAALTLALRSLTEPERRLEQLDPPVGAGIVTIQMLRRRQEELLQLGQR